MSGILAILCISWVCQRYFLSIYAWANGIFRIFAFANINFIIIMENENKSTQLQIELKDETAKGLYSNLAIINHSQSEFIIDFASVLPGLPKAQVVSRLVITPENAKRLLFALQGNVMQYEAQFGSIQLPEQKPAQPSEGKTFVPPLSDFKGEA